MNDTGKEIEDGQEGQRALPIMALSNVGIITTSNLMDGTRTSQVMGGIGQMYI